MIATARMLRDGIICPTQSHFRCLLCVYQVLLCAYHSYTTAIVVAHLGSAGFPLLARDVLDLDYLGAHEPSLLPMPHEVHLAKRPHPQYLQPLVPFHLLVNTLLLSVDKEAD